MSLPHHILIPLGITCVLAMIIASIFYRRTRGKPVFKPTFPNALFAENWRSGRCLRSLVTRIGGANNCLWIVVTPEALHVGPHFPFNLMFLAEFYGLEHVIPGDQIRSVDRVPGTLTRNRVRVRFIASTGNEETIELSLRDRDAFVRAAEQLQQASARAPHRGTARVR